MRDETEDWPFENQENMHFNTENSNVGKSEINNGNTEEYSNENEIDLELRNDFDFIENANFKPLRGGDRIIGLSHELDLSHLSEENFQPIKSMVENFNDVFFLKGDKLTHTDIAIHEIETSTNIPINKRQYRFLESTKAQIDEQIEEMEKQGIIKPSRSPWNASVLCVPKKVGPYSKKKYRIVVDFRALNTITKQFVYPIPLINEILDNVADSYFFISLDLKSGFYQVPIHARDAAKMAFSTHRGHFEFTRMPMGMLKNRPPTFKKLTNTVLYELKGIKAFVYLDDVIVFGRTVEEHNENLRRVLEALRKHNLKLEPGKCHLLTEKLKYLGHEISKEGVRPNGDNVEAIRNMSRPKTIKEVRAFLGTVGFYGKFIPNIAARRRPLNELLKKGVKFDWSPECEHTFNDLRMCLTSEPLLIRPNYNDIFVITTDASDYAIGAVLSNEKTTDRPIAYASRGLVGAERKYHTIEKELLAIVWAVEYFKHYIFGQRFIIYTDHRPLISIWHLKETSSTLTRLRLKQQRLECDIRYKQGRENVVADFLSRLPSNKESNNVDTQAPIPALVMTRAQRQRENERNSINHRHPDNSLNNRNLDNDLIGIDMNDNIDSKDTTENNISEDIYEEFKEVLATTSISTEILSFTSHIVTCPMV